MGSADELDAEIPKVSDDMRHAVAISTEMISSVVPLSLSTPYLATLND